MFFKSDERFRVHDEGVPPFNEGRILEVRRNRYDNLWVTQLYEADGQTRSTYGMVFSASKLDAIETFFHLRPRCTLERMAAS